jgi:hypothetical protein
MRSEQGIYLAEQGIQIARIAENSEFAAIRGRTFASADSAEADQSSLNVLV